MPTDPDETEDSRSVSDDERRVRGRDGSVLSIKIPVGWTVRSLRSVLRASPEYGINAAAVPSDDRLPTYLRITDISEDHRFRPAPRVAIQHPNSSAFFLQEGDLVFARTGASVGKSYLYDPADGPLVFAGFLIRVQPNEDVQPAFLAYCVQSERYWGWVASTSSRSGQPGINGREYGTYQLWLPPPDEQRAIAEALSDVDGLIESLEALIAKKRAVKTAAMQQLLTGRTRLPAFRDTRWKAKKIEDLLTYERPDRYIVQHEDYVDRGDVPVLTANRSFVLGYVNETFGVCIDFPVILFDDFTTDCKYVNFPFKVKSSAIKLLRAKKDVSLRYMCERMKMLYFPVVDHRRYYISDYRNIEIAVPAHDEQISIAAALSDMDAEIGALDGRLAKVRALKQGMMQQLLTGRIRLPASPGRSRRVDRTVEEVGRSPRPAELDHLRSMEQNPSTPGR